MENNETVGVRLDRRLSEVIDFYRGLILDAVEQELGAEPNWPFLRGRLLKSMGDRGLAGKVREIISSELGQGGAL